MSNGKRQCSECDFYEQKDNKCHFQPPVLQYVSLPRGDTGYTERRNGWPSVDTEDWCGQFKAKA